jgi:hypothetical protein
MYHFNPWFYIDLYAMVSFLEVQQWSHLMTMTSCYAKKFWQKIPSGSKKAHSKVGKYGKKLLQHQQQQNQLMMTVISKIGPK